MSTYVKKPVRVEAFQFGAEEYPEWFKEKLSSGNINVIVDNNRPIACVIETPEGEFKAYKNDYIVKGIEGEIYPVKQSIFEKTYTRLLECDKSPLEETIKDRIINEYLEKVEITKVDVFDGFIGENILIKLTDNNKKRFKRKTILEEVLDVEDEDLLNRYVEGFVREYAYRICKTKIFKEKRKVILENYNSK